MARQCCVRLAGGPVIVAGWLLVLHGTRLLRRLCPWSSRIARLEARWTLLWLSRG